LFVMVVFSLFIILLRYGRIVTYYNVPMKLDKRIEKDRDT